MTVIPRLVYELVYYDFVVHRFNHYTTRTPLTSLSLSIYIYMCVCVCVCVCVLFFHTPILTRLLTVLFLCRHLRIYTDICPHTYIVYSSVCVGERERERRREVQNNNMHKYINNCKGKCNIYLFFKEKTKDRLI